MCKAHPPRDTDLAETFATRYVLVLGKFGFFVEKITHFLVLSKVLFVKKQNCANTALFIHFLLVKFWCLRNAAAAQS